jgi:hypothetical protein
LNTDAKPVTDAIGFPSSPNFQILDCMIMNTNLLDSICESFASGVIPTRLLTTIQLVLTSRSLTFFKYPRFHALEQGQRQAYMPAAMENIFLDSALLKVNVNWALYVVNFFRNHLLRQEESTLFNAYKYLDDMSSGLDLPQYWKAPLKNAGIGEKTAPLGKHWKGTYGK